MNTFKFTMPAQEIELEIPGNIHTLIDALRLIDEGKVIGAIKAIRASTGWGLKEAKDYVDNLKQLKLTKFEESLKVEYPEFFL